MSEWLTIVEAAAILGIASGRVSCLAKRKSWKRQYVQQSSGRPVTFYAQEDVLKAADSPAHNRTLAFIAMRDWVDGLPKKYVPTSKELEDHVLPPFKARDVESLVETRTYREHARAVRRPSVDA